LAGAGRTVANVFTGRWDKLSVGDAVDLVTTALFFVPGLGIGSGLARAGVKGAKIGTRIAAAAPGLGRAVPKAAAAWAKTGTAGQQMISRAVGLATKAARMPARQFVATPAGLMARSSADYIKGVGKFSRAASAARRAEVVGNLRAGAWTAARAADAASGRMRPGYERGQAGPRLSFGRFHEAADDLEEKFQTLRMMGDKMRGKQLEAMTTEFVSSFENFKRVAGKYYDDGRVPYQIEERYLQLSRLLPPLIANKINRRIRDGEAGVQPRSFSSFEEMMALPTRGGGMSMPVAAATGGLPGFQPD